MTEATERTEDARITHAREILAAYDAGNHDVTGHLAAAVRMLLEVTPLRPSQEVRSFIPYEVPLRPGVIARLVLPVDLAAEEAERLCAFVRSLAFDTGEPFRAFR